MIDYFFQDVVQPTLTNQRMGKTRTSNELSKSAVLITPTEVRCIWLRHDRAKSGSRGMKLKLHLTVTPLESVTVR